MTVKFYFEKGWRVTIRDVNSLSEAQNYLFRKLGFYHATGFGYEVEII